jgi:CrcB protein
VKQSLLVGAGGFLGAVLRFQLAGAVFRLVPEWRFPLGTVLVNVTGCMAAGVLAGLIEKHDALGGQARLFLLVGVLGGYTTFSAFSLETVLLLQKGQLAAAVLNVLVSVLAGLGALWAGLKAAA